MHSAVEIELPVDITGLRRVTTHRNILVDWLHSLQIHGPFEKEQTRGL